MDTVDDSPGPLATAYLHGSQGVFVPLAAVRIAGDPASALLLGQLLWWTSRAEHPNLVARGGHEWLPRAYGGWADEIGLTEKQARTAVARLVDAGVVETHRWKHEGAPTTHLRVRWGALEDAIAGQNHPPERAERTAAEGGTIDPPERAEPPLLETERQEIETSRTAVAVGEDPIDSLCVLLADLIAANGSKRPDPHQARWRDACRLMIERDGRTHDQIRNAIVWCQADEFWRANVMSMPKLRAQYDTLRLRAKANNGGHRSRGAREADEYRALRDRMAALDDADQQPALEVAS